MTPHLDDRLVREFPLLYADRNGDMRETCMCWGFCVGDGWFPLLYRLSAQLEPLIAAHSVDPDYGPPRAAQVKEKFGTLRFYMSLTTDEMDAFISAAEKESARTCEECGATGTLRTTGWLKTQCDTCFSR